MGYINTVFRQLSTVTEERGKILSLKTKDNLVLASKML